MTNMNDSMKTIDLPVRRVFLMEDRARVVRRGTIDLDAGTTSVRIDGVSLLAVDKSLQARFIASADGSTAPAKVIAASLQRECRETASLPVDDPALRQKAMDRLQTDRQRLSEQYDRCNTELSRLQKLEERAIKEMGIDTAWCRTEKEGWAAPLDAIQRRQDSLLSERAALAERMAALDEKIEAAGNEEQTATAVTKKEICRIELQLDVKESRGYELEIEYVVPNACWRPCYTATLQRKGNDGQATVTIEAQGCVWQRTGEEWTDVGLTFSTERPSLGVTPPELDEDLLTTQKKPERMTVELREQEIETAGLGQNAGASGVVPHLPGIDDGGEVLSLESLTNTTVPCDGMPLRVALYSFTAPATSDLIALPELAECAFLQSQQTNTGSRPLLAGPVDLVCNHGPVGRTSIDFIAPGEQFTLGWGPDAEIRITRIANEEPLPDKILSAWEERRYSAELRLSNLGAATKFLQLTERIPVSEVEEVEIILDDKVTADAQKPDINGFVAWNVSIEPFGKTLRKIAYVLRKKKSVAAG
jgi:uncharacterized protein (TIGR02231 family)